MSETTTAISRKRRNPVSPRRLRKLPKSNGITAIFVPTSKRRGVKLFTRHDDYVNCYRFQKRLAEYGLAPAVFEEFELTYGGVHYYAFVTERAEVVVDNVNEKEDFGRCNCIKGDALRPFHVQQDELLNALEGLGLHWNDCHWGNLGFLGDRCVVIDCDPKYFRILDKESKNGPLAGLIPNKTPYNR